MAQQNYTQEELEAALTQRAEELEARFDLERQALLRVAEQAVMAAIQTLKSAGEWSVNAQSRVDGVHHMEGVLTDLHAVMHAQAGHRHRGQGGDPSGADTHALDRPIPTGSCEGDRRSPNCSADIDRLGPLSNPWTALAVLNRSRYGTLHALVVEAYMLMGLGSRSSSLTLNTFPRDI